MINFIDITYLRTGSQRQKKAYKVLTAHSILTKLANYTPILTGTIPINIDIENSDLDIICYFKNKEEFRNQLTKLFQNNMGFVISESPTFNSVKANFFIDDFEIEVFGQNIPTQGQNAYRHMLIEYTILAEKGEAFRQQVIDLKKQGIKTEPAFAQLLGLEGNAYEELLKLEF
ncbi:DUF4269 domain-containing protein [Pedobacter aquatilis]|uniref:DUF4269 domain-containing protein n=1 Tax=Pedobacter aquatilis TaxID=351343 RepID=UPI00292DBB15|nr:DUF4269 domain-containing protein [Pedobacter aquatilis]